MSAPSFGPKVPSPCVSVCRIDPETSLCHGCLRTIDEIADWPRLNDEQKDEMWRILWKRKADKKQSETSDDQHASNSEGG